MFCTGRYKSFGAFWVTLIHGQKRTRSQPAVSQPSRMARLKAELHPSDMFVFTSISFTSLVVLPRKILQEEAGRYTLTVKN